MIWDNITCVEATKGTCFGEFKANRLVFDSRMVEPGDFFIALKGENTDGHLYVSNALNQGASAAIVSKIDDNIDKSKCLLVEDTYKALYDLARYKRKKVLAKFISITGSVGKTSTREFISICLSCFGKVHTSRKNYNNHIGLAIDLASTPNNADFVVLEMGMNHKNEITPLSILVNPDVAIITNVEAVHLEFFNDVSEIALAKAEIFLGMDEKKLAILNSDNSYYEILKNEANRKNLDIIDIGKNGKIKILNNVSSENCTNIEIHIGDMDMKYIVPISNKAAASNSIFALALVKYFSYDVIVASKKLLQYSPPIGRGEIYHINFMNMAIIVINDSYNASPISIKESLKSLGVYQNRRKVAILGDMLELGKNSVDFHKSLLIDLIENRVDKIITIGELMKSLYDICPENIKLASYAKSEQSIGNLKDLLQDGDVILIKGSFGVATYMISDFLIKGSK